MVTLYHIQPRNESGLFLQPKAPMGLKGVKQPSAVK